MPLTRPSTELLRMPLKSSEISSISNAINYRLENRLESQYPLEKPVRILQYENFCWFLHGLRVISYGFYGMDSIVWKSEKTKEIFCETWILDNHFLARQMSWQFGKYLHKKIRGEPRHNRKLILPHNYGQCHRPPSSLSLSLSSFLSLSSRPLSRLINSANDNCVKCFSIIPIM